jgi:hypothetical protein
MTIVAFQRCEYDFQRKKNAPRKVPLRYFPFLCFCYFAWYWQNCSVNFPLFSEFHSVLRQRKIISFYLLSLVFQKDHLFLRSSIWVTFGYEGVVCWPGHRVLEKSSPMAGLILRGPLPRQHLLSLWLQTAVLCCFCQGWRVGSDPSPADKVAQ